MSRMEMLLIETMAVLGTYIKKLTLVRLLTGRGQFCWMLNYYVSTNGLISFGNGNLRCWWCGSLCWFCRGSAITCSIVLVSGYQHVSRQEIYLKPPYKMLWLGFFIELLQRFAMLVRLPQAKKQGVQVRAALTNRTRRITSRIRN